MAKKISVANLVMLAGAVVCLLFSFFSFYEYGGDGRSAWSRDIGAYVTTIPAFLAVAMLAWGIAELVGAKLPNNVLTFSSNQLKATWGISAAGIMLAFLSQDMGGGVDKGIGFWLMFLGSAAMCAGAVMALLGKGNELLNIPGGGSSTAAPTPPPPGGGIAPPPPPPPPPPAG